MKKITFSLKNLLFQDKISDDSFYQLSNSQDAE